MSKSRLDLRIQHQHQHQHNLDESLIERAGTAIKTGVIRFAAKPLQHPAHVYGASGRCVHATEQKISPTRQVGLFGSAAIVQEANLLTQPIQQPG
ncbi:MAG: hypothetical protein IPH35_15275 [Rhodoferax sp.]|nr:hypothetical protein [Rhodoferax sp.]